MPYIKKIDRPQYDTFLNPLIARLEANGVPKGDVVYCIFKIVKRLYGISGKLKFTDLADGVTVLECTKLEFAEILKAYEMLKKQENGDIT